MERYFNRDLSWLSFNYRVLQEAQDNRLPLYERIKFLAIYSSNLDEFFKVRVASIQSLRLMKRKKRESLDISPKSLLDEIYEEVERQLNVFGRIFRDEIHPALEEEGIFLLEGPPKGAAQLKAVREIFEQEVMPFLHPQLLAKRKIRHFLRDEALYLAVQLVSTKDVQSGLEKSAPSKVQYAIIQLPTHYFARFVRLPDFDGKSYFMFLDDIIRLHLPDIFPGFKVAQGYSIKLSRNADLRIEDEFSGDLVTKIREGLRKRQTGFPARFLYDPQMPANMLAYLQDTFSLRKREIMKGGRYHNFKDFFAFPNPLAPRLEREPMPPMQHPTLEKHDLMISAIKERSWMLHFPYHRYDYVIRFLNQAAEDPQVKNIRTTQYRIASNSAIVDALIRAAQLGKEVTVFVELKARFDEAANLLSAQRMQEAGIRIIHSIPGLKVHAKVALVEREEAGEIQKYAFLSTGNFNEKTAKVYADHGYFTADPRLTNELSEVFRYLQDQSYEPPPFQHILVAQFNMRQRFQSLIEREIKHAHEGRKGHILIKLNNLEDEPMINLLYEASQAGVKIDLIIRGICRLRPGVAGMSEHIRVIRLVDQFLEHGRVFVFYNDGAEDMYLGSADWMTRNLSHRIEVVFPLLEPDLKGQVMEILHMQLRDTAKATRLNSNLENEPIPTPPGEKAVRMQTDYYEKIRQQALGIEKH